LSCLVIEESDKPPLRCFTCTYYKDIDKPHKHCLDKPDVSYLMECQKDEICQNMVRLKKNGQDFESRFLMVARECRRRDIARCPSSQHCVDAGVNVQECFTCCSSSKDCLADL